MKTSELTGAALDWAVAICEPTQCNPDHYSPSTDWAQGGPIIEREDIALSRFKNQPEELLCSAYIGKPTEHLHCQHGPTPLIAAMRCYVASKLGDEVEIPEELT
jgi:hypothetical protein